jgi:hypothetical protein
MRPSLILTPALAVLAAASPPTSSPTKQDVLDVAALYYENAIVNGCDWLACVSSLAGETAACAAAALEAGLSMPRPNYLILPPHYLSLGVKDIYMYLAMILMENQNRHHCRYRVHCLRWLCWREFLFFPSLSPSFSFSLPSKHRVLVFLVLVVKEFMLTFDIFALRTGGLQGVRIIYQVVMGCYLRACACERADVKSLLTSLG